MVDAYNQLYKTQAEPNYVSKHREITNTILNHDYTATEPRWQSTINMMEKSSTEQRIFNNREIAVSDK
jgi:hypothetical protein